MPILGYGVSPILVCLLTFLLTKASYDRTLLPIGRNPSTDIEGAWHVEYWEVEALEPRVTTPDAKYPLTSRARAAETQPIEARIEVDTSDDQKTFTMLTNCGLPRHQAHRL